MLNFDLVPDELIRHILLYASPEDNLRSLQRLSQRFRQLANESLLWKHHCLAAFTYWHPEHRLPQKLASPAADVDWKALWLLRKRRNVRAAELLEGILASQVDRLNKFAQLGELGYDAKDFLVDQCRAGESAEDVLARRYHGSRALDSIHRSIAVREWSRFQDAPLSIKGLDRALGAFDMFVLHDRHGDMDEIAQTLDDLAARFRAEHAGGSNSSSSDPGRAFDELSTRDKAVALLRWVRANNLAGMDDPTANYRNLRNCLIGQVLCDPSHPSLPIISSVIYCCLAERVGLTAACCAFPSHVHAAVFAPPGRDLDGHPSAREDGTTEKMFLDPYGCDDEVTVRDLRERLAEFGWLSGGGDVFLTASPAAVIVQRTAQNIKSTYMTAQHPQNGAGEGGRELLALRAGDPEMNLQAAVYAALWAGLLITPASSLHWDDNLGGFLTLFAKHFSEDAWVVERHLLPLYDAFVNATPPAAHHHVHAQQQQQAGGEAHAQQRRGWENVREALAIARNLDARRPAAQRRYTQDIREAVRHRVGQVFRHRRYGYVAIINGWAVGGVGSLPTPNTMSMQETLDQIEDTGGAHQSRQAAAAGAGTAEAAAFKPAFYTCLRATVDRHVVAQANVDIITDPALIPEELFFLAGKFFKRFDRETCAFVSNVKEFYPDD